MTLFCRKRTLADTKHIKLVCGHKIDLIFSFTVRDAFKRINSLKHVVRQESCCIDLPDEFDVVIKSGEFFFELRLVDLSAGSLCLEDLLYKLKAHLHDGKPVRETISLIHNMKRCDHLTDVMKLSCHDKLFAVIVCDVVRYLVFKIKVLKVFAEPVAVVRNVHRVVGVVGSTRVYCGNHRTYEGI